MTACVQNGRPRSAAGVHFSQGKSHALTADDTSLGIAGEDADTATFAAVGTWDLGLNTYR